MYLFLHLESAMIWYFSKLPVNVLFYYPVAGQRHHGWGRKNSFTKEAVAKIVDDIYRLNFKCFIKYSL
jgi:hypothetical protein